MQLRILLVAVTTVSQGLARMTLKDPQSMISDMEKLVVVRTRPTEGEASLNWVLQTEIRPIQQDAVVGRLHGDFGVELMSFVS